MPKVPRHNPRVVYFSRQQDKWRAGYAETCTSGSGGRAAAANRLLLNLPHDSALFLGGKEETTLKSWSALLGKETIDMYNTSITKGNQESHGQNFQKLGKDLMSIDELAVMSGEKCILQLRGVRPFFSNKFDITQHPNYQYLSDADPRNAFDIERYLSTKLKLSPTDRFEVFETDETDELAVAQTKRA